MSAESVSFCKVTARCPVESDALVVRLRIDRLLQTVDFSPPGFPPQAVLLVRRLVVPGALCLSGVRPGAIWEREARDAVMRLYRRAVRPWDGRIPADADVLLFSDMAEMLAYLGLALKDASSGHWYRQVMLRRAGSPASFAQALLATRSHIPAAVTQLARWGRAVWVLESLEPSEIDALYAALVTEFGLPPSALPALDFTLSPALVPVREGRSPPPPRGESQRKVAPGTPSVTSSVQSERCDAGSAIRSSAVSSATRGRRADPPWFRWLPHPDNDWQRLTTAAQDLLGVSLALCHAPLQARSGEFIAELRDWRNPSQHAVPAPAPSPAPLPQELTKEAAHVPGEEAVRTQVGIQPESATRSHGQAGPSRAPPVAMPVQVPPALRQKVETAETVAPSAYTWPWSGGASIETHLSGVFYLLNLFVRLDLPDCFAADGLPNYISGWGLAEAMGRSLLLDGGHDDQDADPLWLLLAQLDGRAPNEPPAAQWQGVLDYRLPEVWSRRLTESPRMPAAAPAAEYWATLPSAFSHWLEWTFPLMRQLLCQASAIPQ